MTGVDFYILDSNQTRDRLLIACRLTEKAWHNGYRTLILTESATQQKTIDDLLWTFRPGSFVPHSQDISQIHPATAVILNSTLNPQWSINLLINLQSSPVDPPENIERIIEIVDQDEQVRKDGRQRYRHYQNNGKALKTHRISI